MSRRYRSSRRIFRIWEEQMLREGVVNAVQVCGARIERYQTVATGITALYKVCSAECASDDIGI